MYHRLSISGSTIMTDREKFPELFSHSVDHIEIGEFTDQDAFESFLKEKEDKKVTFSLHSPLYRSGSKYDLLEEVLFSPEEAWVQFENEVKHMSELGAEYVLVHFPYFKTEGIEDPFTRMEKGLARLNQIQEKHKIMIVCEPKLGFNRSPIGMDLLHQFPIETWAKYNVRICIDIGDYLIGAEDKTLEYIKKWSEYIKVVHLHNVEFYDDKYIWVPVHPSHELDETHFKVKAIIEELAKCEEVTFVFEHTPHSKPTVEFVREGMNWVKEILEESEK